MTSGAVVQATGFYFPDSTGGTEVYVDALAQNLARLGCASTVLAPSGDLSERGYDWNGVPVRRFPWGHGGSRAIIGGREPHQGFSRFEQMLAESGAAIYHQHAWTGGCGPQHLRAAKRLGLRTVVTVHVPGFSCLAGTMMRDGLRACAGRIDEYDCSSCWATVRKGVPAAIARPAAYLSRRLKGRAGAIGDLAGRATAAFDAHRANFDTLVDCSDRIVAVCQWLQEALLLNGVDRSQLVLSRQGVSALPTRGSNPARRRAGSPLRIGFLGRLDPVKGLHVLVEAIRGLPADLPVQLDAHGIVNDAAGRRYENEVRALAGGDPRIRFLPAVPSGAVYETLGGFDVLAVPSQWLETGPIVVMEALAAGTYVLGSRLGGIAELVRHGTDGWLVAHDSPGGWREAIERLVREGGGREGPYDPGKVRTMGDVAREMLDLYRSLGHGGGE